MGMNELSATDIVVPGDARHPDLVAAVDLHQRRWCSSTQHHAQHARHHGFIEGLGRAAGQDQLRQPVQPGGWQTRTAAVRKRSSARNRQA